MMNGFLKSGPIIRLRIGDLFCAANGLGLPGYITNLDLTYDDGIWNIKKDFKVPRLITVSIAYTVMHEHNPGLYKKGDELIFGTGQIKQDGDKFSVEKVSRADIRKIFDTVRK